MGFQIGLTAWKSSETATHLTGGFVLVGDDSIDLPIKPDYDCLTSAWREGMARERFK